MKTYILIALFFTTLVSCQQEQAQSDTEQHNDSAATTVKIRKPTVTKACTKDARICPDGSTVSRNSSKNCEFDSCPKASVKTPTKEMCTADVKQCIDGSFVSRDHYNHCKFKDCPKANNPSE